MRAERRETRKERRKEDEHNNRYEKREKEERRERLEKLGKLGKILGPKGLMPNPKMGTVSDDIVKAVDKVKNKSIEVKNDKDGNFSFSIGRKSFQENKLLENVKSAFEFLKKEKSSIFNSENIKKVYFSTTMSPSFKLNFKDI